MLGFEDDAACRNHGADPDDWWPEDFVGLEARTREARAKAVCAGCPVQMECFERGVVAEKWGVWGGTSARERRELRSQLHIWVKVYFYDSRHPDREAKMGSKDADDGYRMGVEDMYETLAAAWAREHSEMSRLARGVPSRRVSV